MNFTHTGTLTGWVTHNKSIIPSLHEVKPGIIRGGAFLCLPNFEALPLPFQIMHGEYRKEACGDALPHKKIIESPVDGWGTLATSVDWSESETLTSKILTVHATLGALSEKVYLRPGFHPYFSVSKLEPFVITVVNTKVEYKTLPYDKPLALKVNQQEVATATLETESHTVILTAKVLDQPESFSYSFCVWSDNKDEYVCIEPVIGSGYGENGLPTPFILEKGKEITLVFMIEVVEH